MSCFDQPLFTNPPLPVRFEIDSQKVRLQNGEKKKKKKIETIYYFAAEISHELELSVVFQGVNLLGCVEKLIPHRTKV